MHRRLFLLLIGVLCMACTGTSQNFVIYRSGSVVPVISALGSGVKPVADGFINLFEKATGAKPKMVGQDFRGNFPVIQFSIIKKNRSQGYFTLEQKDNVLHIGGTDVRQLYDAIQFFFTEYARVYTGEGYTGAKHTNAIIIPGGLKYTLLPAFEYREPYFPNNFKPDFRRWNNTQTLEENWGLWGHNIRKVVKVTTDMQAKINGKVSDEQLCFSSPELEQALEDYIARKADDEPALTKFMIMPDDNMLVCQCDKCKAHGNTKTNASPAVFSLLNKLAKKFTEKEFFSTAYMTTQKVPAFNLEPNAGVMVSTMAFPKGIVIEDSNKKGEVEQVFGSWKKVTGKIYLWDYAVNFDNYFDAYPTVSVAKQNLNFYKKQGVTGVFMHGSEEKYSAFSGVKCYLYAQLLQNPEIDIDAYTKLFFDNEYTPVSDLLYSYYMGIERAAYQSTKPLDIYGGIVASQKKYLDSDALNQLYKNLLQRYVGLDREEQKKIAPLMTSFTFQKLEIARTNGFEANGYANYNESDATAKIKSEIPELLKKLKEYADLGELEVYNESSFTISSYINSWETEIIGKPYKNLFYAKPFKMVVKPDEDYPNVKMLNDGNIGFNDYYNNWLVKTFGTIALEVNTADVKGAKVIEMAFLNDAWHNIHFPEKVVVKVGSKKYEAVIPAATGKNILRYMVSIPVVISAEDKTITIEAVKQASFKNKAVASDGILFK